VANIYEQKNEDLYKLLDNAKSGDGATILIPDLQRPYVWTPNQVSLLVDSLIRGWPFGTLLMWKAGVDDLERIPHRQFWQVVDKTSDDAGTVVTRRDPPAAFHMVLDGQQRVQSLLLALGGDGWGFKMEDKAWKQELQDIRQRGRTPKYSHWSKASLCFDVDAFLSQHAIVSDVQAIDYRNILQWIVTDPADGQSKWKKQSNYVNPLERADSPKNGGRYIRLSRLWAAVSPNPLTKEKQFREDAERLFEEHKVPREKIERLLQPIGELMSTLRDVKVSKVTFLELQAFDSAIWDEDGYNDAIVNIFTRLNTAGRTLTRQEITLAWLKVGWEPKLTGDLTAGTCFETLGEELSTRGVNLDIDELVMAVSFIWSVICNDGQLLANKDLLRGSAIQPMAHELSRRWNLICESILEGLDRVRGRGLKFGSSGQFDSLYAISVLWAWLYAAKEWSAARDMKVLERDAFEKTIWQTFDSVSDRWLFGSSWAELWSSKPAEAAQKYAKQLSVATKAVASAITAQAVHEILEKQAAAVMKDIEGDAIRAIDGKGVSSRGLVSAYRDMLWVWHRIDDVRWKMSKIPLRTSGRAVDIEVDHLVSVGIYETLAKAKAPGDDFEFILLCLPMNSIGNCSLLEKSFNISKSDKELATFLADVYEFKEGKLRIEDWTKAMTVADPLLHPKASTLEQIAEGISAREKLIKAELADFIRGTKFRVDLS